MLTQHFNLDKEEDTDEFTTPDDNDVTEFTGSHMILAILLVVMTTVVALWWFNHTTRDCRKSGM